MANITMKDIARAMNVDLATVSRALNDQYGVSDAVRSAIKNKAEEMGYRPNALARRLATNRGNTIAYMAPDLANLFHVEIAHAVKYYFHPLGYTVLVCDSEWELESEIAYLDYMERHRVDGIILKSASCDFSHIIQNISCPVTMVSTDTSSEFSTIDTDNFYGGFMATEALIRCGYRRIAYLGAKQDPIASEHRGNGYRAALVHYELPYQKSLVGEGDFSMEGGRQFIKSIWKRKNRPDAIFCINDDSAIGVMDYLLGIGIRIPEDFGVIGYDNMTLAALSQIQLSTIAQQGMQMGKGAAELLYKAIRSTGKTEPEHRVIAPTLILRKTTRPIGEYQPTPVEKIKRHK